jgi:Na+-driven multidrug efflux pump
MLDKEDKITSYNFKEMSLNVVKIVGPTIIGQIFCLTMETINTVFIGHLGDTAKVAGVGLGNMYINVFS